MNNFMAVVSRSAAVEGASGLNGIVLEAAQFDEF